jgi:hypothetical protein
MGNLITAAPASARPRQITLTLAAPMSSQVPANSEEDIRGIRQPRHLPTPIPWAAAAAGVITSLAAVGGDCCFSAHEKGNSRRKIVSA